MSSSEFQSFRISFFSIEPYTNSELIYSEKVNAPKTVNDVKLINGGKILENNRTLGECKSPICDFSGGITTMHVVLRPPSEKGTEKKAQNAPKEPRCGCVIL